MQREKVYIYGKHALEEALESRSDVVQKVFLSKNAQDTSLVKRLKHSNILCAELKDKNEKHVSKDAAHQGVIAEVDPTKLMRSLDSFLETLNSESNPCLVLLDELHDPQNMGAIIRSAAAFGAAGILVPIHNQVQVTGAVVKASAGMVFRVPLISIQNVNLTLRELKDKRFWIYGLATDGANELSKETFNAPAVFVIGNEGEGIREKTLEHCDITLSIPMHARTESLNAAASAAVVLYEWSKQHCHALS